MEQNISKKVKEKINELKEDTQKTIAKKIISGLSNTSDENLIKLTTLTEQILPKKKQYTNSVSKIKGMIQNNRPAVKFIRKILKEIDSNCRDKLVENLIIKGFILNHKKRRQIISQGNYPPFSVLISPSMRCNLSCIGCYAGRYSKKDDLGFELFDKIVTQGEEMGVGFFTILGGEPLIIKDELFKICKKHNKAYFQFYTNGTLINKGIAEKLKELGNLIPMISIEGNKKETDERRGQGVYDKVMNAMDLLKKNKVPFGFSVTVTRKNAKTICSDKFIDAMIGKGAYVGWFFLYMPIGQNPDLNLMPTPKQRKILMERWKVVRKSKPIFIIDFWNDAPFVGGCIAGKSYIHINSNGDVEPCIFTHFAVDNIKNKSLNEIMASDFFKEIRARQPFDENLYLPCMWIDEPEFGRVLCARQGCYPTHKGAEAILKDEKIKKGLDKYSIEVKKEFRDAWKKRK